MLLHLLLLFFSLAPVLAKLAGRQPFLSVPCLLYYGGSVAILGIYALVWQQIIKRMPLTAAYANRAIAVIWGMIWGFLFFQEQIQAQEVLGALIIAGGVILYALAQKREDSPNAE